MFRVAVCAVLVASAGAQAPRWVHHRVTGSGQVAVYARIRTLGQGGALTRVAAACLEFGQRQQPAADRYAVEVVGATILLRWVGPADRSLAAVQRLSSPPQFDADSWALAVARERLRADDSQRLYPGDVLFCRAQHLLSSNHGLVPRPTAEQVAECQHEEPQSMLQLLRQDWRVSLVTLGDISAERLQSAAPTGLEGMRPNLAKPTGQKVEAHTTHPRIDGPFVTAATVAPPASSPDFAAFVVTSLVLRGRMARLLRYHGSEGLARFPFVRFEFLQGERVLALNRRGRNGSAREAAGAELRAVLEGVAQNLRPEEIDQARQELQRRLARPPFGGRSAGLLASKSPQQARAELLARARVLAVWPSLLLPEDLLPRVGRVDANAVKKVVAEYFNSDRMQWLSLTPTLTQR